MKVLIIGGGGREHTLAWKLANDRVRPELFCAPGNAGTAELGHNLECAAEDVGGLLDWAKKNRPDLTVVGPEAPLCAGLVDQWLEAGLKVFGPTQAAARLEGSKVFSKDILQSAGVPTASAQTFSKPEDALIAIRKARYPLVVKADGLAAGKGVIICGTKADAEQAIHEAMVRRAFGDAGTHILIEDYLDGEEASILALVDGEQVMLLPSAQDHKRVYDRDQGPNTGGMGAYSPAPVVDSRLQETVVEQVFRPTLKELRKRKILYQGVLYAGLMIGREGPKVLEFNCRFGDPETQVILPRLSGDLIPLLEACIDRGLSPEMAPCRTDSCVCVVMAAGGYPMSYRKGDVIKGLREVAGMKDVIVFHAGTRLKGEQVVTAGGRVLGVTALGNSLATAAKRAYEAVAGLSFDKAHFRTDIAARGLLRQSIAG